LSALTERNLLLVLTQWKSDTFMNTSLHYNAKLSVLDSGRRELASKTILGRDNLGGSAWDPQSHARKAVPIAFAEKLEELLSDPSVVRALR
jgi:hypothetical protein